MRALTELARRADVVPVPIQEISDRRAIPLHILEQLFASLRRAGILKSQRGVKGGYSFNRPPREVTVLAVVECVDGPLLSDAADVSEGDVWAEARSRLRELFASVTLADIAEREARSADELMFHI